jgi:hypothetical protein
MKVWKPHKNPETPVIVSFKIDGVNATRTNEGWFSRAGKPLNNLPHMQNGTYEVFLGSFKDSISAVKTKQGKLIDLQNIYMLSPELDRDLLVGPSVDGKVMDLFSMARQAGYEGLVVEREGELFKVKDKITLDVEVDEVVPGNGKHSGRMGALWVVFNGTRFKVGTGFADEERSREWTIGELIEVSGMELTDSGRLRHPRFERLREDLK